MHGNTGTMKITRGFSRDSLSEAVDAIADNYSDAARKIRRVTGKLRRNDRAAARARKFAERLA
jgi:hypothetical protein